MKRSAKRSKLGFTLIEITIVLGIVGLVLGGIFAAWGAVTAQNKMRSAEEQISTIVNQIRSAYGNRSTLENATGPNFTNALISSGLMSDTWIDTTNSGSTVRNPYSGNVVVTPDAYSGVSGIYDGINITMTGLSRSDCKKLANDLVYVGRRQGLYKMNAVNVTTSTEFSAVTSGVCTAAGNNTISLYFRLKTGD